MPPRTNKGTARPTPKKTPETATPEIDTPDTTSKKRKVDWATIDDKKPFGGFKLEAVKIRAPKKSSPSHKKQRTGKSSSVEYKEAPLDAEIVTKNPFSESELSETHYNVKPPLEWESTLRYRKFTISEAEFEVGQVIFVNITEDDNESKDVSQYAFARILEVRAGDASHVFLRVYYLYKPEELPEGRQPHHGDSELIASNHMDIIEAMTVVDRAEVVHWDENPENSEWPLRDQWFWRQTYDIEKPKAQQLSKLRQYCIDKAPCNPDEPLINCSSCAKWLHAHCLEEKAVEDAYEEQKVPARSRPAKNKKKGARRSSTGSAFTAHLTTYDTGQICLTVTDNRPGEEDNRWNVDVKCLLCQTLIEKAAKEIPPEEAQASSKGVDSVAATPAVPVPSSADEEDSVVGNDTDTDPTTEPPTSDAAAPPDPVPKAVPNGETTVEPSSA
ncbi:hypothetical protein CC86DRAFT_366554 [Ophiobolus disseminans]|uniref:BAH domain-containing protein n=1 Tax=Ophiobolus disseminans TaxID=1469910 RepID=A0A6A7ACP1_9PLEO|nr:hypothetical protein CC86DRAFT_366554 [Ophiobolus disseminans]